ncbi:MAG: TolC family protein [Bacteroidetes bacterium]|nr:TolC family protein [Bacteroidota bacterium]
MNIVKITLIVFLFHCCNLFSFAEGDGKKTFSLEEAQSFAIEHNLNIKNAEADVKIARKKIWETTAIGLPQVNVTINYTDNLSLTTVLIPDFFGGNPDEMIEVQFGTQHNALASITATQQIFSGPYIVGLMAAKVYRQLSEQNLEKTEIDVKEMVTRNYYLILLSEEIRKTLLQNYNNTLKTYKETKAMFKQGFVEETDVDQLKVTLTTLDNSVNSMERQVKASKNMLKFQMGLDLEVPVSLTDSLNGILGKINLQLPGENDFNIDKNIEYNIMETQVELASLDLKRQKSEYLPTLSIMYMNNWDAQRTEFNFFDSDKKWYETELIGFTLDIPVFSSGSKISKISQKQLAFEKAIHTKKLIRQTLEMESQQVKFDYNTALEKYLSEKENVKLAKRILEKTRIKYKNGMASSFELIQANNQYLQTESNITSAIVEILNVKIRLDKITNRL